MPLFVFISGYFTSINTNKNLIRKYLIPYLFFQVLYYFFFRFALNQPKHEFSLVTPEYTLWFMLALFVWNVTLPYITNLKYPIIITFIIGAISGFEKDISYYMSLSRILGFYPFFLLGYYFKTNNFSLDKLRINKLFATTIFVVAILILNIFAKDINIKWFTYSIPFYKLTQNYRWYYPLYRILLNLAAVFLSIAFISFIPKKEISLTRFSFNTLSVYLIHGFIVQILIKNKLFDYLDSTPKRLLLIILAMLITLILSSSIFKKLLDYLSETKSKEIKTF